MEDRGRPWWAALVLAVPVALLLAGLWKAIALFVAVCAGVVTPMLAGQWWSRHRQRVAHASGAQVWAGHLALDSAVVLWDVGVGAAFLFGAGVPVRLTPRPLGLLVERRRSRLHQVVARHRAVRASTRPTSGHAAVRGAAGHGRGGEPEGGPGRAPVLVSWTDIATVRRAGPTRVTGWGRVGVLPFDVIEVLLHGGGVLPFATPDASGLADLVALRTATAPGSTDPTTG
ncbi:hypothetical protein Daura_40370 [Dactylosporangium aurantiacum]|uniref:Uncharacterized protein n=1 Tax=Dactylosporangium aurantiacum TaxID=35754 RepID=A0A9Q9IHR0_9ACTN|nr:hypothetical protein [Dactylosporangium aurantiacum]MDG6102963.1 hypothetical protein [Dactylosporangium aurantiacum]UWZ52815.1 hypothetical protein Daura_40370 [Dactylosporangium aurantiacum]